MLPPAYSSTARNVPASCSYHPSSTKSQALHPHLPSSTRGNKAHHAHRVRTSAQAPDQETLGEASSRQQAQQERPDDIADVPAADDTIYPLPSVRLHQKAARCELAFCKPHLYTPPVLCQSPPCLLSAAGGVPADPEALLLLGRHRVAFRRLWYVTVLRHTQYTLVLLACHMRVLTIGNKALHAMQPTSGCGLPLPGRAGTLCASRKVRKRGPV